MPIPPLSPQGRSASAGPPRAAPYSEPRNDKNDHRAALGVFEQVIAHARLDRALELADVAAAAAEHAVGGGHDHGL